MVAGTGSWAALGLLIALNGGGRACAMLVSDRLGRRHVLGGVLTLLGLGQLLLAADALVPGAVLAGAVLAGLGGGAFYPLIAGIVRECFGQERTVEIHTVVYSAKALSGILGVALVPVASFAIMCAPALAAALIARRLRRPGRPATLPA
jgi:MFS family permease